MWQSGDRELYLYSPIYSESVLFRRLPADVVLDQYERLLPTESVSEQTTDGLPLWEVEVEMRVKRTFRVAAPDGDQAREVVSAYIELGGRGRDAGQAQAREVVSALAVLQHWASVTLPF